MPHCLKAIKTHNESRTNDVKGLINKLAEMYLRILETKNTRTKFRNHRYHYCHNIHKKIIHHAR